MIFSFATQGIINSVGTFLFDSIKPLILKQVNEKIQTTMNEQMRSIEQHLPDSIPPLDLAMALAGKKIREENFDPFNLPPSNSTIQTGVVLKLTNGFIRGLSTVHR